MKYYLCNKCGGSILFVEDGEQPSGMCSEPMAVRISGICGGGYTIELIPQYGEHDVSELYEEQ